VIVHRSLGRPAMSHSCGAFGLESKDLARVPSREVDMEDVFDKCLKGLPKKVEIFSSFKSDSCSYQSTTASISSHTQSVGTDEATPFCSHQFSLSHLDMCLPAVMMPHETSCRTQHPLLLEEQRQQLVRYWKDQLKFCEQNLRMLEDGTKPTPPTQEQGCKEGDTSTFTTVMLKNLPGEYSREMLLELLNEQGFEAKYNFVYRPADFKKKTWLGYAFVNLIDHDHAERFMQHFEGFADWKLDEEQPKAETRWGQHHDKKKHIERYRDSPLMHPSVPDAYKPVVFEDGEQKPFPLPRKRLQAPRAVKASTS